MTDVENLESEECQEETTELSSNNSDECAITTKIDGYISYLSTKEKQLKQSTGLNQVQILIDLYAFEEAIKLFTQLSSDLQKDQQYQELNIQITQFREQQCGVYDWNDIILQSKERLCIKNTADFFSPKIEIFHHETMGRGVRATEDLQIGEIILVEKAFLIGTEAQMYQQLQIKQNYINGLKLAEYKALTGGTDLNYKTLYEKSCLNSFYLGQQLVDNEYNDYDDEHTGLFIKSSCFNHSCLYNVETVFINDLCVKIIVRNVAKGDQLFNIYGSLGFPSVAAIQSQFNEQYNFICGCPVCKQIQPIHAQHIDNFIQTIGSCYSVIRSCKEYSDQSKQNQSDMYRKYLYFSRVTLIHFESYSKDNDLNLQILFCQTYRDLAQHFMELLDDNQEDRMETFFLLLRKCRYLGINSEKAFRGELEFDVERKFTSYIDVEDLLDVAVYAKKLNKEFQQLVSVAKQLHERLIGSVISFEELYKQELASLQ